MKLLLSLPNGEEIDLFDEGPMVWIIYAKYVANMTFQFLSLSKIISTNRMSKNVLKLLMKFVTKLVFRW